MNWTDSRLTLRECEEVLRDAGINPDCSRWTTKDCERADEVLKQAAIEKLINQREVRP